MKLLQILLLLGAGALAGVVVTSVWLRPHRTERQDVALPEPPSIPVSAPAPSLQRLESTPSPQPATPSEKPLAEKKVTPKLPRKPAPIVRAAVRVPPTLPPAPLRIPPLPAETPPSPANPRRTPHTVTLRAGMIIPIRLVEGLSAATCKPGDTFVGTMDQEMVIDGFVIVEHGAPVEGRITAVERGGSGWLTVELTHIYTSDRQHVVIRTESLEHGAPATLPAGTRIQFRLQTSIVLTEKFG